MNAASLFCQTGGEALDGVERFDSIAALLRVHRREALRRHRGLEN